MLLSMPILRISKVRKNLGCVAYYCASPYGGAPRVNAALYRVYYGERNKRASLERVFSPLFV